MGKGEYSSQSQQPVRPKGEWAYLHVDKSEDSSNAEKLLRDAGYCVISLPVNGTLGPVLELGRREYKGLEEIMKVIDKGNN